MADRVRTAALAGALIVAGCAAAAWGSFTVLSIAACPPFTSGARIGGCVPVDFIPWWGLAFLVAVAVAGVAILAYGIVLYRRAKARPAAVSKSSHG